MSATAGRPYPRHTKVGALMAIRGLRAFDVAKGADVYPRTLSDILSGARRPTPPQLAKLAHFFGVAPDQLLEDAYPHLAPERPQPRNEAGLRGLPSDRSVPMVAQGGA